MKKKLLSILLVVLMLVTMIPASVLAATLSNGRLPIHFFLAEPEEILDPNGNYTNYKQAQWGNGSETAGRAYTIDNIQDVADWDTINSVQGIRNAYYEDTITQYVGSWPDGSKAAFDTFDTVTFGGRTYSSSEYEIKWVTICNRGAGNSCWCRVNYEHIHIDGLLVKKVQPGTMSVYKSIPEASNVSETFNFSLQKLVQNTIDSAPTNPNNTDSAFGTMTLSATIEAGQTTAAITGGSSIDFGYYKLTENDNSRWQPAGMTFTDGRGNEQEHAEDVLYIYIAPDGTVKYSDTVSGPYTDQASVTMHNERKPYTVTYEWKVHNTDGTHTELPAGAPSVPETDYVAPGSAYAYDTEYEYGTSFIDNNAKLIYSFTGWETYSHSDAFNDNAGDGYYELPASGTITITDDTYIYGCWTVSELPPMEAHVAVEKVFILDGVDVTDTLEQTGIADAKSVWFRIDPGVDKDGDGKSQVDIEYTMIKAANGEYMLPVYQYEKDFVFTEFEADIPGYSRETNVSVSGDSAELVSYTENTNTAVVKFEPEYASDNDNGHLGKVTFTNTYTKNTGTPVTEYPELNIVKHALDTGYLQAGATFKLYSDSACTNEIATYTTPANGLFALDFAELVGSLTADGNGGYTMYLKETAAPEGYLLNNTVYTITLTPNTVEELRGNEFVMVTTYGINVASSVSGDTGFVAPAAEGAPYVLNIYNEAIHGTLNITKDVVVTNGDADEAKSVKNAVEAVVIVHGPLEYGTDGTTITGLGRTYEIVLNAAGDFIGQIDNLPRGDYLIHESFASVHGYTWTDVTYGTLGTTVYNNITSGVFTVEGNTNQTINLTLTNTYTEWSEADFYIYKHDERGNALEGATFVLYADEARTQVAQTKTTGADGYAHFTGFDSEATYFLAETVAPSDKYNRDATVYKVEIKAVTSEGTTTYEPKISVENAEGTSWVEASNWNKNTDLLRVLNARKTGSITIKKEFAFIGSIDPSGNIREANVLITGPEGYSKTVTLNSGNNWTVTVSGLYYGDYYTVVEMGGDVPGYSLKTTYTVSDTTAVADRANVQINTTGEVPVTITNNYTMLTETFEVPTQLKVMKVDKEGNRLAGAKFKLTSETGDYSFTFVTNEDGYVEFHNLDGLIENGEAKAVKYTLEEVEAPAGYAKSDATWEFTVKDKDGVLRIEFNEDRNIFEQFWDWIVGAESTYSFTAATPNAPATVKITNQELANLTITKNFENGVTVPDGAIIEVEVLKGGNVVKQIELKADNQWTYTLEDIPAGEYTVRENSPSLHGYTWDDAVFVVTGVDNSDVTKHSSSVDVKIENSEDVQVTITNNYTVWTAVDFYVMKVDEDGNPLAGAKFNLYSDANLTDEKDVTDTYLHIDSTIHTNDGNKTGSGGILHFQNFTVPAGQTEVVYYLKETAPENYYPNDNVYKVVITYNNSEYDIAITDKDGNRLERADDKASFNPANDVLTVVNEEILADLVIEKTFPDSDMVPLSVKVDVTSPNGYRNTVTLGTENGYKVTLTGLSLGEYTIKEQDANQPGYKLDVTYDGVNSDNKKVTLTKDNDTTPVTVKITNKYEKIYGDNVMPKLYVQKYRSGTTTPLAGAEFTLNYTHDENGNPVSGGIIITTDATGKIGFNLEEPGTYTLVETKSPDTYAENNTVYTILVKYGSEAFDSTTNKWIKTYVIESVTANGTPVNLDAGNTLKVYNTKDEGTITVTKEFGVNNEFVPEEITVNVKNDSGVVDTLVMNEENNWTDTTILLPLGEYELEEVAEVTGYYCNVVYSSQNVEITADIDTPAVTITNTYTTDVYNPTSFEIKKVDSVDGTPIAGVVFGLFEAGATTPTFKATTDSNGTAKFADLDKAAVYTLKEITPHADYVGTETTWEVTVKIKDGDPVVTEVEANTGIFENIFNWIVGVDPVSTWANGVLTVENTKKTTNLVVSKEVEYYLDGEKVSYNELPADFKAMVAGEYSFEVTVNGAKETIKLKAGESKEFKDLPYGTTYSVTELFKESDVFNITTPNNAEGTIGGNTAPVKFSNHYNFWTYEETRDEEHTVFDYDWAVIEVYKADSETNETLKGAEYTLYSDKECKTEVAKSVSDETGKMTFVIKTEGTFYIKETKAPEGYDIDSTAYPVTTEVTYTTEKAGNEIHVVEHVKATSNIDKVEGKHYVVDDPLYPEITVEKKQSTTKGATTGTLKVYAGDVITYTITVKNDGDVATEGLQVADVIPEGLVYVKDSVTEGGIIKDGIVYWDIDKLDAGEEIELSFKVTVPEVETGKWANVVQFIYDNNADGENEIEKSNEVVAEYVNTPNTGDVSSFALFAALAALAAAGFVTVLVKSRKKEN